SGTIEFRLNGPAGSTRFYIAQHNTAGLVALEWPNRIERRLCRTRLRGLFCRSSGQRRERQSNSRRFSKNQRFLAAKSLPTPVGYFKTGGRRASPRNRQG